MYRSDDGTITGGWPVGYKEYEYEQHTSLKERIMMAKKFVDDYDWTIPTYVDNFDNDFDNEYGAWPDRVFLFDIDETGKKILKFKALLEDGGFREGPFTGQIECAL